MRSRDVVTADDDPRSAPPRTSCIDRVASESDSMPELPEVERARKLVADSCRGFRIADVETTVDKIVYCGGTDNEEFAKELVGRTIEGCERKGKMFWLVLSGDGRLPVMHFGMTGMLQLKGEEPTWYRQRPKERTTDWPPRFMKFILKLEPQEGSASSEPVELAFIDARRLARLRLLPSPPLEHPPLSLLGFDPVLGHPTLEEFCQLIQKKKGTVKGMIMDQAFSAGVGNWVADEILYQARIHPACPVPALTEQDVERLWHWIEKVPTTAVAVNADHTKFPEDWLFRWRWGKGKKQAKRGSQGKAKAGSDEDIDDVTPKGKQFLSLPDGSPATISFIEVGGRTTAVVDGIQKMPPGVDIKAKVKKGSRATKATGKAAAQSDVSLDDEFDSRDSPDTSDDVKPVKPTKKPAVRRSTIVGVDTKVDIAVPQLQPKQSRKRKVKEHLEATPGEISDPTSTPKCRPTEGSASTQRSAKRTRDQESSDLSDAPSL